MTAGGTTATPSVEAVKPWPPGLGRPLAAPGHLPERAQRRPARAGTHRSSVAFLPSRRPVLRPITVVP